MSKTTRSFPLEDGCRSAGVFGFMSSSGGPAFRRHPCTFPFAHKHRLHKEQQVGAPKNTCATDKAVAASSHDDDSGLLPSMAWVGRSSAAHLVGCRLQRKARHIRNLPGCWMGRAGCAIFSLGCAFSVPAEIVGFDFRKQASLPSEAENHSLQNFRWSSGQSD
jgi:hypothetical protein